MNEAVTDVADLAVTNPVYLLAEVSRVMTAVVPPRLVPVKVNVKAATSPLYTIFVPLAVIEAVVGNVEATGDADVAKTVNPSLIGLVITADVAISFYDTVIVYYPGVNDGVLHVA